MRVVVCIRQGLDGEISPFDACAYEAALRVKNAEVILLSMGTPSVADFLKRLSRLGASKAILGHPRRMQFALINSGFSRINFTSIMIIQFFRHLFCFHTANCLLKTGAGGIYA